MEGSPKREKSIHKDKGKVIESDLKEPRHEPKPQRRLGQICELEGSQAPRHADECGALILSQLGLAKGPDSSPKSGTT